MARVASGAQYDDATDGFALTVEFGDTTTRLGTELNMRHVAEH